LFILQSLNNDKDMFIARKRFDDFPLTLHESLVLYELSLPLAGTHISAGFPSPAADFTDGAIDLNKELIRHPSTTFYGRVRGDSMRDAGLGEGDLLVIDKSEEPKDGKIAVCFIDGEFTVKRLSLRAGECYLLPANPSYKPIRVGEDNQFIIWGIVTHVIKSL
jgi:DNA polymerase V